MFSPSKTDRIDAIFAEFDRKDSPGCALGIVQDGELAYFRGFGMADLENDLPITKFSAFEIASTSKQFTAACILLLAQRAQISLDDDIRSYLPDFPFYGEPIRISHLLYHTSGLRDYLPLRVMAGESHEDPMTQADAVALVSRQRGLNFKPGESFSYSNSNYLLLAEIVRIVSGLSLSKFADENMFKPLGMTGTCFIDDHRVLIKNRASSYLRLPDGRYGKYQRNSDDVGAAGIITTIPDLYRWDQNFYDPKVGGKDFLDRMLTCGRLNTGKVLDYAGGLFISEYRGLKTIHHAGFFLGFHCQLIRFPGQSLSVICISNLDTIHPAYLVEQVADICLFEEQGSGRPVRQEPVSVSREVLHLLAATYHSPASGRFMEIFVDNDLLMMEAYGDIYELTPVSPSHFSIPAMAIEIKFTGEDAQPPQQVQVFADEVLFDTLAPIEVARYSPSELAEYTGYYLNEEIEAVFKLSVISGQLFVQRRGVLQELLKPGIKDAFRLAKTGLNFSRSSDGKITGFALRGERVAELNFVRRETRYG